MTWSNLADKALQVVRNTLGDSATYTPNVGSPYPITGVFTAGFEGVDPNAGVDIQSYRPTFTVRGLDLATIPGPGDHLTRSAIVYEIVEAKQDGEGGVTLFLNE